ncbi:MAG: hypothetical protein M3Q97_00645 [Bacteroidota bacterium]|nr:hypothetical protein [Bacteroidota bacterium]
MKKITFLLITLLPLQGFTQFTSTAINNLALMTYTSENDPMILAGSYYLASSNSLTNKLYLTYATSNFISEEIKDGPAKRLKEVNRFGGLREDYAWYIWSGKKYEKGLFYTVGLKNNVHYSASFPKDAYLLPLYGNSRFAGQTAEISPVQFNKYYFQSLQFGIVKHFGGEEVKPNRMGLNISLIRGYQYIDMSLKDASLYTSEMGDSLHYQANLDYYENNLKQPFSTTGGMGLALNGFYVMQKSKYTCYFTFDNIGFVAWRESKSKTALFDTTGSFTGFDLTKDTSYNIANPATAYRRFVDDHSGRSGRYSPLPVRLSAGIRRPVKFGTLTLLVEQVLFAQSLPRFRANLSISANESGDIWIQPGVNFLGYGTAGLELGFYFNLGKFNLGIGTEHLEAFFLPARTTSQNLAFRLIFRP